MKCPACNEKARCLESRPVDTGTRRRYRCECGAKFITVEELDKVYTDAGITADRVANLKAWATGERNLRNVK